MPETDLKAILVFPVSIDDRDEFFAFYSAIATVFTMIMNAGLRSTDQKKVKFEEQAPPEHLVPDIIEVLTGRQGQPCPAFVFGSICKVMQRFTLLDVHPDFYPHTQQAKNPYFSQLCKHFSEYSIKLNEFAETLN